MIEDMPRIKEASTLLLYSSTLGFHDSSTTHLAHTSRCAATVGLGSVKDDEMSLQ